MKGYIEQLVLIFIFALLSLAVPFYLIKTKTFTLVPPLSAKEEIHNDKESLPTRLKIPKINVNAEIKYVGIAPTGEMETPDNISDVGWFSLGPKLGEKGSAVIAGHFNGQDGEAAVFSNLDKLQKGDSIYIEDDEGKLITFIAREIQIYDPGFAEEVFSLNDGIHLNLITCDGVWNESKKSFSKRLVVFADVIN